jgi:hypothetical protein
MDSRDLLTPVGTPRKDPLMGSSNEEEEEVGSDLMLRVRHLLTELKAQYAPKGGAAAALLGVGTPKSGPRRLVSEETAILVSADRVDRHGISKLLAQDSTERAYGPCTNQLSLPTRVTPFKMLKHVEKNNY